MSAVPTISILTPVRNGLPYIKECVESVFMQDFQDWEFIISDNGSTDGTRDYLDTLKDPRVKIFKQEKNLGIDGNLNFLFTKANSLLAYTLCADDYFYPGALKLVLKEWETVSSDTAFIAFNWKEVVNHSTMARYSYEILPKNLDPAKSQLAFFLFGNIPGNLSNVSCKVDVIRTSGGFDERLTQAGDFEIWARITRTQGMVLSDTEISFVRRHENTATLYLNKQGQLFAEHISIYEKLVEQLSPRFDRKKLINYFNLEICSFHLRHAIKAVIFGHSANMKIYLSNKSSIFWPNWKRLFLCLPFALNETVRMRLLVAMAGKFINRG